MAKKTPIYKGSVVTVKKGCYITILHGELLTVVELKKRYCMCVRGQHKLANIPANTPRIKMNKDRLIVVS